MRKFRITAIASAAAVCLTFTSCGDSGGSSYSGGGASYDNAVAADNGGGNSYSAGDSYDNVQKSAEAAESAPSYAYDKGNLADEVYNAPPAGVVGADAADWEPPVEEAGPAANTTSDSIGTQATFGYIPEYPYYIPSAEEYAHITESGFKAVSENPLSTFSADVDTASYTNIRRVLNNGGYPYPDMVRIEEIMNYFSYDYKPAANGEPFSVTTELSECPWNPDSQLLLVGIKADEAEAQISDMPMNLVFLIDVSGSMFDSDKLPLVQQAFTMLTDNLDPDDRISIVTYAGEDKVVLEGESGENKKNIIKAIDSLSAGGSTAGAAGIKTAYEIAEKYYIEGGNNRVILATDGDLNVGASSVEDLTNIITRERESGVFLSVLGVGEGNLKDDRLEALADNGNGNYSYIDCLSEAKKVLIDEMNATLVTVAKDVKFQVEFNPANIAGYRLIGYENRALADRDFNDDTKDAGEVGAGSTVTVLYELITVESANKYAPEYKYTENAGNKEEQDKIKTDIYSDELLTVNIRCKAPDGDESKLYTYPVTKSLYTEKMPKNLNFAACCAEFGMLLRNSENKGSSSWEGIIDIMDNYDYSDDEYKTEFEYLVRAASRYSDNYTYYGYYD